MLLIRKTHFPCRARRQFSIVLRSVSIPPFWRKKNGNGGKNDVSAAFAALEPFGVVMDSLRASYMDEDDDTTTNSNTHITSPHPSPSPSSPTRQNPQQNPLSPLPENHQEPQQQPPDNNDEDENKDSDDGDPNAAAAAAAATNGNSSSNDNEGSDPNLDEPETELEDPRQPPTTSSSDEDQPTASPHKKQKPLSSFGSPSTSVPTESTPTPPLPPGTAPATSAKKPKKKSMNPWTKSTSRKNKKKTKVSSATATAQQAAVLITPVPRFPDRSDDSPDAVICLSKIYKAEKVELGEDRLSAGSCKGYRMVRATRGVAEGAWYFEIKLVRLGETGHTRLGWSMEKGDLQAPVGYDGNSFGYRDVDGSKVHRAVREAYGKTGYVEGDVVGCYINLPDGELYAPKPPQLVLYKGQRYAYAADGKDDPPKVVPGNHILKL
ncbi:hypothetical protein ACLOJK_025300 [Asimina triloba]